MNELVIVAVVLIVGWIVVAWMLWENGRRQSALAKTIEDLDSQQ
jgi:hypothetical protein